MAKYVVSCPVCSFSFIARAHDKAVCPSCGAHLKRDGDGDWCRIRRPSAPSNRAG